MKNKIKKCDDFVGTSFHGDTIYTSVAKLIELCGEPYRGDIDDKSQYDWFLELEDGTPFTIYDWKQYRFLTPNEHLGFHIGGRNRSETSKAKSVLEKLLYS